MAMKRIECLKVMAKYRTNELALTCWQSINAWEQLSPSKYNFQSMRTMGECSTFGLGLALARPDKRIIVLEGDGSLCMNLASLITIAMASPPNFYQFIMHNRVYETSGGQTIPNIDHLDLTMIARGAGISAVYRYSDVKSFEQRLPAILKEKGPVFTVLDIVPDETHVLNFGKVRAQDKFFNKQFREALAE